MEYILTIAIPTYNRLSTLRKSLSLILNYTIGHDDIEVIVSDNASTDGTKEYIQNIQKKYRCLKYYRNSTNMGLDGNFLNCFKRANGKYLWMISDDDYLMPEALEEVLSVIMQNPIIVFCNPCFHSGEDNGPLEVGNTVYLEDRNAFFMYLGIYITFVSSLVYKMSLVRNIENIEQYRGDNLLLSHVAINIMREEGKYVLIKKHCLQRSVSEISYDFYKTFFHGMMELLFNTAIKSGFNENAINKIYDNMLKWVLIDIIFNNRKDGNIDENWDKKYIYEVLNRYPYFLDMYNLIIDVPKTYLAENYLKIQRIRMNEVIDFCNNYENVYFYGCGGCAEVFYQYLKEAGVSIKAIIISNGEEKRDFHGIKVFYASELLLSDINDCIIVTPYKKTFRKIKYVGGKNNYYYNKFNIIMNPISGRWV